MQPVWCVVSITHQQPNRERREARTSPRYVRHTDAEFSDESVFGYIPGFRARQSAFEQEQAEKNRKAAAQAKAQALNKAKGNEDAYTDAADKKDHSSEEEEDIKAKQNPEEMVDEMFKGPLQGAAKAMAQALAWNMGTMPSTQSVAERPMESVMH